MTGVLVFFRTDSIIILRGNEEVGGDRAVRTTALK